MNGFSGAFTNVARAAAPILSGGLITGMVHATRELRRSKSEDGDDVKGDVALFFAEGVQPDVVAVHFARRRDVYPREV